MNGLSIITICFNNLKDLKKTCASVEIQSQLPDEHWIINGSTNTEIENWLFQSSQPNYRKWVNEPDRGISDAFNKGIKKSGSSIIHLLNSGDVYASKDVVSSVKDVFNQHIDLQWVSGNIQMIRAGKEIIIGKPFQKSKLYRGMRSVSHPTWFVKREVYNRVGFFNDQYNIAMDYDLMCRIANEPYLYLNKLLVVFDDSGVSTNHYIQSLNENRKVYESYFGFSFGLSLWQIRLKILHYVLQTGLGKWLFGLKNKLGLENM